MLLLSIAYIPMNVYWHSQNPELGFELSIKSIIFGLLFMSPFQFIAWMFLLKTNNPITRYNPFSLNPKWTGEMKGSLDENPGQILEMDTLDDNEIKMINRNKKLNQLLK